MIYLLGMPVNMAAVWLFAVVVFLVIEALVPGLVSLWFAIGALAALLSAALGAPMWLQLVWFFVVSVAALLLTRPLVRKFVNGKVQHIRVRGNVLFIEDNAYKIADKNFQQKMTEYYERIK